MIEYYLWIDKMNSRLWSLSVQVFHSKCASKEADTESLIQFHYRKPKTSCSRINSLMSPVLRQLKVLLSFWKYLHSQIYQFYSGIIWSNEKKSLGTSFCIFHTIDITLFFIQSYVILFHLLKRHYTNLLIFFLLTIIANKVLCWLI